MAFPNDILKGDSIQINGKGNILCFGFPKQVVIDGSDESMSKENAKNRKNGAIYLYVGHSGVKNSLDDVYIGKTENDWLVRIREPHGNEKTKKGAEMRKWWENDWKYTFLFTPEDKDFEWPDNQLSYLESTFFYGACDAKKCNVVNDNNPPLGNAWSRTEALLDDFIGKAGAWMSEHKFNLF